jgi:hypothetical protein
MSVQFDSTLADQMVEEALETCAETHFAGDLQQIKTALIKGECEHCRYLSEALAKKIAMYLSRVSDSVKAVFQYESIPEPIEKSESRNSKRTGINLVVWVERKSPAFRALVSTLESTLAESQRALGCPVASPDCYTINVDMVDDLDVQEKRGFGLFVQTGHLRCEQIWSRADSDQHTASVVAIEKVRSRYDLPETFDPDLIPESRLIEHARTIERLPLEDRETLEYHLTELKVTLIRRIISDQLSYINIAKDWFSIEDLEMIYRRRLGLGRIGGKSAGMLLANRIIQQEASSDLKDCVRVPDSYFLGSDLMYIYMAMNGLMHWNDQKYKPEDQIRSQHGEIVSQFLAGEFPPEILIELEAMLEQIGPQPIIVRSSSQLEDSLNTSFAGKYDSYFCPNQASAEENLKALTDVIARTYASTFNPDALLYRRSRGLQDYDERMAVLIQVVEGEAWENYYLPFASGVAYSRNIYRWAPRIRSEEGFVRLVWGLGTRAVQRIGDDYPRLVALSHPTLQPDDSPQTIQRYSQHYIDLIDLENNKFKTLPVEDVLKSSYPALKHLVQFLQEGYLATPRGLIKPSEIPNAVLTFATFLNQTDFAPRFKELLELLEREWGTPVDVEFAIELEDPRDTKSSMNISLLQCRPLPSLDPSQSAQLPQSLKEDDIVFSSRFIVPQGYLNNIRYVVYVVPEGYFALESDVERRKLGSIIGQINKALDMKSFICVGPGRWGTINLDLGVQVGYADIDHAGALVEVSGETVGPTPEPSLGTHFFHDLLEAQIYPVAINLDDPETLYNRHFFYEGPNKIDEFLSIDDTYRNVLRVVDVEGYRSEHHLEMILDDEQSLTTAFFVPNK